MSTMNSRSKGTQRRAIALLVTLVAVVAGASLSASSAGASRAQSVDPSLLALPAAALPAGAIIDHNSVSDDTDADASNLRAVHQNLYETLKRVSGYRLDIRYMVQGVPAATEYLASIFDTPALAQAAMQDAIAPGTLIDLIGKPLPHQCTVGDICKAYSGPDPGTPNNVVLAIFTDGPIMVETASAVPSDKFDALEPALETSLFGFLAAADAQVKIALAGGAATPPAVTETPTATATVPPIPPAPTATPKPAPKKHCKKGYKLVHGKCKKKKKK
jgi:hypothetical protein